MFAFDLLKYKQLYTTSNNTVNILAMAFPFTYII